MMNKRLLSSFLVFGCFMIWMLACEKENISNVSAHQSERSHYVGENCMNCHYQAGPGDGWFSVAGSVYGNYENHTVRITDALTQEVLVEVEIDQLGNLHTTEAIDFSNGITIVITDEDDPTAPPRVMSSIVNNGQCNLCHNDKEQAKIFIP